MYLRNCKYCKNEYQTRDKRKLVCSEKECQKQKRLDNYKILKPKNCNRCSIEFQGTIKQKLCEKCRVDPRYKDFEQKLSCKRCGKIHKIIMRKISKSVNPKVIKIKGVCGVCKMKHYNSWSKSQMGENNTNYNPDKRIPETREEMSERMKVNNPMFDLEVKARVSNTLRNKYESGEIERPVGRKSPLWKGNRKRSYTIRTRCSWWTKKCLEESNYSCQKCGIGGHLEVHHESEPMRDIIETFTNGKPLDDYDYEEFIVICQKISEYHKNVDGLVVCKTCHSDIDNYRKINKDENKTN